MTALAQFVLDSVPLDQREAVFRPCTLRLDTSEILGIPSTFDCENGELHLYSGVPLTITPEREAAIRAWCATQRGSDLIAKLKLVRDRHWQGGCAFGPLRIQTDQESIANITGAYSFGKEFDSPEHPFTIEWSLGQGTSVTLTLENLRLAAAAVFQHIQACNARYLALYARITAGESPASIEADLETGWPE